MSRFYGSLNSGGGQVTRGGGPNKPLSGHIRGWGVGAKVYMDVDSEGRDVVEVYATHGSNGAGGDVLIARFTASIFNLCDQCSNREFLEITDGCAHGHPNAIICQADHPGDFVTQAEAEAVQ